jgi:signal transduction histidine kinase
MSLTDTVEQVHHGWVPGGASNARNRAIRADASALGVSSRKQASRLVEEVVESSDAALFLSAIKMSRAISGALALEKMLDTVMRIAIEHAGAKRGILILARAGEQRIAAEVTMGAGRIAVQMRDDAIDPGSLPHSVFQYVVRSREIVILDEGRVRGPFTADRYTRHQGTRSILCLPLLKQASLVGVLYLENALAARAFTPMRIAVLELVASQTAICLENARLRADLQKAQRLEAMATLAAGIAHDFNNILGAIAGFGEMALRSARKGTRLRRDLDCIMTAADRARALVERILTFSRSAVDEPVPVHVEQVVRESLEQLQARLPNGIRIESRLRAGRAAVRGNATQVHQVVMNLGTNAIHAMPAGGTLLVSLDAARCTARTTTVGKVTDDEYVVLTVADNGTGIARGAIDRIFNPYFTTKKVGTGTGLGLSLVHGIVTQFGGAIDVSSKPGQGSEFTVYLPRSGEVVARRRVDIALPRGGADE